MGVAAEEFVAALAAQGHRDLPAGGLSQQIGGDDGGVGQGFVQVPQQLGQQVGGFGGDPKGFMGGAQMPADQLGEASLVILGHLETHVKGADFPGAQFGHGGGDRAGIESAGEKDPQGHIRHQLEAHRFS